MTMDELKIDLMVIGGGSAGVRAARVAAELGAKVVLAERDALGGTCVNRGCVPKKFLVYAAAMGREQAALQGGAYGWCAETARFDWRRLRTDINRQIGRLNTVYGKNLDKHGVVTCFEHARFLDAHRVRVGERIYRADKILIAVGGAPRRPSIDGAEHAMVSDDAFEMEQMPFSVLVVGGGYIALEFVNIFEGLGARTTLAYRGELFLRGFDDSLRTALRDAMLAREMDLRFGITPKRIVKHGERNLEVIFDDDTTLRCAAVMYAIGRAPATDDLGLDVAGVKVNQKGQVEVDAGYATSVPHIYALGDVTGGLELTPVAIAEGEYLVRRLYGSSDDNVDLSNVPTAVFSQPELATVGLTEREARALHPRAEVYQATFTPLRNSLFSNSGLATEKCLIKLIASEPGERGTIVGAHMAGTAAAEIIQVMALAIKSGAGLNELKRTIGLHPTTAEEFVTLI